MPVSVMIQRIYLLCDHIAKGYQAATRNIKASVLSQYRSQPNGFSIHSPNTIIHFSSFGVSTLLTREKDERKKREALRKELGTLMAWFVPSMRTSYQIVASAVGSV